MLNLIVGCIFKNEVNQLFNKDKTLTCKDCGQEFVFTASEQDFLLKKDSLTNPKDANPAVMPAKIQEDLSVKCLMLFVLLVESLAKFLFSPGMIARFIAVNAFQSKDNLRMLIFKYAVKGVLFTLSAHFPCKV